MSLFVFASYEQSGTDYCFTSGFMGHEYSASGFETVYPYFGNCLLPVKLVLNRDMVIFKDYATYAVARFTFQVAG